MPMVRIDPKYYRPTEVERLLGNPAKAKRVLGWEATTPVEALCKEMVEADVKLVKAGDLRAERAEVRDSEPRCRCVRLCISCCCG